MAFFNLTHLGPQDPFRVASAAQHSSSSQETTDSSSSTRQPEAEAKQTSTMERGSTTPPAVNEGSSSTQQHKLSTSHVVVYSSNKTTTRHGGSHTKYTELLRKHQRDTRGPTDHYQYPLTTSQMYGWWMKESSPQKEKWAKNAKHVHVNSEMTRFVDEMSLTNKEFTLY